jgi:hypothetical protein
VRFRRRVVKFIHDYALWWYAITALLYGLAIPATIIFYPNVGNLFLSCLVMFSGFTASMASLASVLDDAEDNPDSPD